MHYSLEDVLSNNYLNRLIISIFVIILLLVLRSIFRRNLGNLSILHNYEPHRLFLVRKIMNVAFWALLLSLILLVWGVRLDNVWVYFGSFLSVVAIGFFAVWSLLSNIIAGMFIFILNPLKVGSKVKLFDPEVTAEVININLMFTELKDDEGVFSVPNNAFFQKTFKVLKH